MISQYADDSTLVVTSDQAITPCFNTYSLFEKGLAVPLPQWEGSHHQLTRPLPHLVCGIYDSMPDSVLRELNTAICKFFWQGKSDLVSRSTIAQHPFFGGFSVV